MPLPFMPLPSPTHHFLITFRVLGKGIGWQGHGARRIVDCAGYRLFLPLTFPLIVRTGSSCLCPSCRCQIRPLISLIAFRAVGKGMGWQGHGARRIVDCAGYPLFPAPNIPTPRYNLLFMPLLFMPLRIHKSGH